MTSDEIDIVAKATYSMPKHGWTCFHCGETFKTPGAAQNHFGQTPNAKPGCLIKAEPGLLLELRKAETEISQLRGRVAEMEWQPIETAPKDGTQFLVANWKLDNDGAVVYWDEDGDRPYRWRLADGDIAFHDDRFTHWRPLPSPPSPDRGMK